MIETPAALDAFPELRRDATETHRVHEDDVLAEYSFDENVRCSLPGRHPHANGLVVRTVCGLTLCMGRDCGRKCVNGFAALSKRVDAGKRLVAARSQIRRFRETLPSQVAEAAGFYARVAEFRTKARENLPSFANAMTRQWKLKADERVVAGTDVWDPSVRPVPSRERLEELFRERGDIDGLEPREAAEFARYLGTVLDAVRAIVSWQDRVATFFTDPNLTAAIAVAGLGRSVIARESELVATLGGGGTLHLTLGECRYDKMVVTAPLGGARASSPRRS